MSSRVPPPKIYAHFPYRSFSASSDCDFDCGGGEACSLSSRSSISNTNSPYYVNPLHAISITDHIVYILNSNLDALLINNTAWKIIEAIQTGVPIHQIQQSMPSVSIDEIKSFLNSIILLQHNNAPAEGPEGSLESKQLTAWLHITDRCNLRCAYCYLPHKREDMSLSTGISAIDTVFRSAIQHNYHKVKIKYAGGEPLLNFALVEQLQIYAKELSNQYNIALDSVILTNGTLLTNNILDKLQQLNIRLMISLDGIDDWHDNHRPYAGGKGTFKDVVAGITQALSYGMEPVISITVSGRNALGLPRVIEWVLSKNLPFSINFYRENAFSAQHRDLKLEEDKILQGMHEVFRIIENSLPKYSLLSSLTDRANLAMPHHHTCSAGRDYLVFTQHGDIAKCQMQITQPITHLTVSDPLTVIRQDSQTLQNLSVDEKEGCKECDWKYYCTGGCPLETFRATGRYDVKSPYCNIYKSIFPEILRLEGLRLLKEAQETTFIDFSYRF